MFSRQKNLILAFKKEKIIPLHMFFVFFPIDIIYLNKNKKIVEIKENFRPLTTYTPKKKAQYVLELEKGTIAKTNTNISDIIIF